MAWEGMPHAMITVTGVYWTLLSDVIVHKTPYGGHHILRLEIARLCRQHTLALRPR